MSNYNSKCQELYRDGWKLISVQEIQGVVCTVFVKNGKTKMLLPNGKDVVAYVNTGGR